jgi:predicted small secreted protein
MITTFKSYLLLSVAALTFAVMPFAGCNTLEGAGEDVEAAGESVQEAAE